jgi:hypothetical protein
MKVRLKLMAKMVLEMNAGDVAFSASRIRGYNHQKMVEHLHATAFRPN